jgi:hypothetical protein
VSAPFWAIKTKVIHPEEQEKKPYTRPKEGIKKRGRRR